MSIRAVALTAVVISSAVALACGSSSTSPGYATTPAGGNDAGLTVTNNGSDGGSSGHPVSDDAGTGSTGFVEAPHAPFPTIVNLGVPVMATPKIVAITFNSDTNASAIDAFVSTLGSSSWWPVVTKDYGVGAATGSSAAVIATLQPSSTPYTDDPEPPTGSTETWQSFVVSTVTNAANNIPAPDANTIYAFFLPATSAITISSNGTPEGTTCQGVGGYHNSTTANGTTYHYAVIGECANASLGQGSRSFKSELDLITFSASHEILETATDPSISAAGAGFYNDYPQDAKDDLAWNLASDGEVADFCVDQFGFTSPNDTTADGTYTVQRIWSTSAATAGRNPCIPVPAGEIYFNAAPAEGSDALIVTENTATTIEVDAFSDAAKSWELLAVDRAELEGGTVGLTLAFAGGTTETLTSTLAPVAAIPVTNGTKVQLSVTLTAALSADKPYEVAFLISHDGNNLLNATNDHYWPFVVTTSAYSSGLGLQLKTGGVRLDGIQRARLAGELTRLRAAL
jgi:hypothetical protein